MSPVSGSAELLVHNRCPGGSGPTVGGPLSNGNCAQIGDGPVYVWQMNGTNVIGGGSVGNSCPS
jgi:hypothetical protein